MELANVTVEMVSVKELVPAEYNPRYWSPKARAELKASLQKFGFTQPIIANSAENRKGIVIGGNFKLDIAKELEIDTVPVYWMNIPDVNEEKELNLRLNKNQAEFDFTLLAEFEEAMLKEIGFDDKELDKIFQEDDPEDDFDAEAEYEAIQQPEARYGDVYQLGAHRLVCGDATKPEDLHLLMEGAKADMVWTDPPYNVNYAGQGKKTSNTIKNDHMDESKFREFLKAVFSSFAANMKTNAPLYTCYASRTHREFEDAVEANGFKVRNQIIWVKKVASMGWGDYRWKHEPILYCTREGFAATYYGDRSQYTEWTDEPTDEELLKMVKRQIKKEELGDSTVWRMHRETGYDHPTQKPVKLCQIPIRNSSKRGEIVLDLFGGSGSTLIASEKLGRKCYTMELDRKYVDVIVKRFEELSDTKAVLLKRGENATAEAEDTKLKES